MNGLALHRSSAASIRTVVAELASGRPMNVCFAAAVRIGSLTDVS
jgi:hypothetical protein